MKEHTIKATVSDHGTQTAFTKVCRSKSGAIREARELNAMGLIRRYREGAGTGADCAVFISVEDMEGNDVNVCYYGHCQTNDDVSETRDGCNCDRVWPELEARGFTRI